MEAAEGGNGVQEPERRLTEAERRAEVRLAQRADALRANLKRRKSQFRARAEALTDVSPGDTGAPRSADD